jgi:hypothetical protein
MMVTPWLSGGRSVPVSGVSRWRDSGHLERAVETAGGEAWAQAGASRWA